MPPETVAPAGGPPPTFRRQIWFWLGALVVFLGFLFLFSSILLPFVAGAALAYLLDPVADWLERRGLSRTAATLLMLVIFAVLFLLLLVLLIPALVAQLSGLIAQLPDFALRLQELVEPLLNSEMARNIGLDVETIRGQLGNFVEPAAAWLAAIVASVWSGGQALIGVLSLLVITPVVAFYLLHDWDRMTARVDHWLPRQHAPVIRDLARQMSRAISGFIRGQGLLCLVLGIFYAAALSAIGLNFGLLIGLVAGLLSFIPFVGTVVGFVISVGVAAVQFPPEWIWVAITAAIFIFGQFLEGYILQPRLVGNSVGLHPVWLMFALFAFSLLFGFVGTLIAVPVAAMVGVLVRFAINQYLSSSYYGAAPPPALPAEPPSPAPAE
ncbi:MAG: AI-2E family transporter [Bauldia sp.]|nr:AI-2E family transporter [Bauldia sp.]